MSKLFLFTLPDITCPSCVKSVEDVLNGCATLKIDSVSVDLLNKQVWVVVADDGKTFAEMSTLLDKELGGISHQQIELNAGQMDEEQLAIELQRASEHSKQKNNKAQKKNTRSHLIKGILGSTLGAGLMALGMSGIALPVSVMYGLALGCAALTVYLGKESYYDSVKKLVKTHTMTMDTLFTISTLTVIGVSFASFFIPWMPMMMEAGLMIFGFRHLGKAIEDSIKQKVVSGLTFKDRTSSFVEKEIQQDNQSKYVSTSTNKIVPTDIVQIKKGEVIPFDGVCMSDSALIYDTIISGSTLPRVIKRGERILAGMRVPDDVTAIKMGVTRPQATSYLARLDTKILKANIEKAPIETITNKILQYFVPGVIGLAALSGIVIGVLFNPALAIQCATSLLVSACPCTLGFITPLSVKIGMSKALGNGVQFKSGKALQSADQIDTVLFDLNGTLTTGVPVVKNYRICTQEKILPEEYFQSLAVLEQESQHPIAKAICNFVEKKNLPLTKQNITDIDRSHHSGIKAKINDQWFVVGNKKLMMEEGIDVSSLEKELINNDAQQVVYLARANKVIGYLSLKDPLRNDAKLTIQELKKMGKAVGICTGADLETAQQYAKELAIPSDMVFANCLGASENANCVSKVQYIEQLQKQGKRVAMVGDAANDALAIAKSNFGIAVKSISGDEMTQQQAGATVDNSSLLPVVTAFAVAKETVKSIKQNLTLSLGYNSTVMLIASGALVSIGLVLNPAAGVALMALESSLVLLNQYRIKRRELPHLNQQAVQSDHIPIPHTSYRRFNQLGIHSLAQSNKNSTELDPKNNYEQDTSKNNKEQPTIDKSSNINERKSNALVSSPRRAA